MAVSKISGMTRVTIKSEFTHFGDGEFMRIAYVTPSYLPDIGGGEFHGFYLSKTLTEFGHEVAVFTKGPFRHIWKEKVQDVEVVRLPSLIKGHQYLLSSLGREVLDFDPLVIFAHGPSLICDRAAVLAKIHKIHFFEWYIGDITKTSLPIDCLARVYNNFHCIIPLKIARKVIVSSQITAMLLLSRGVSKDKIKVVHPGIDPERLTPSVPSEDARRALGITHQKVVLFVGRLGKDASQKGVDVLIRSIPYVLAKCPGVLFVFVGGGQTESKYRKACIQRGLSENVRFTGTVPDDRLSMFYAAANCHVLPSISRTEGFGLVLLEAMSFGCPVVTTKIVGGAEVVSELQAGIVVDPGDMRALADAILTLLRNDQMAERLGHNGKRVVKRYNWKEVAKQVEKLIV